MNIKRMLYEEREREVSKFELITLKMSEVGTNHHIIKFAKDLAKRQL